MTLVHYARVRIIAVVVASLLAIAVAAPVAAAKPDRAFAPADDVLVDLCEFDVLQHRLVNNEYFTTFFDRDGNVTRSQVNGHLVVELTNLESGKSIVLNASGHGRFVEDADGLT